MSSSLATAAKATSTVPISTAASSAFLVNFTLPRYPPLPSDAAKEILDSLLKYSSNSVLALGGIWPFWGSTPVVDFVHHLYYIYSISYSIETWGKANR